MHYDSVKNNHGLLHDPFKALVTPRPIGWISTLDENKVLNLAPYSFFSAVSTQPHYVMFSSKFRKDSLTNIEQTGEFTCSLATWDLRDAMNISSATVSPATNEFELAGLETAASKFVAPPRVKKSPAALECKHWKTIEMPDVETLGDEGHFLVIGEVVGIYIDDAYVKNGLIDTGLMRPIARLGYMDYMVVNPENIFSLNRPMVDDDNNLIDIAPDEWDGEYR